MRSKREPLYERADNEQQEVWPPEDARDRHTFPLQKGDARPLNEHPKDQNPRLHDLETGRSRRRDLRDRGAKKARRVSQRRELVVVTLGAVTSIAGLGGFLAANPPGWVTTPQNTAPETVATLELEPDGEAPGDEGTQLREAGADSSPACVVARARRGGTAGLVCTITGPRRGRESGIVKLYARCWEGRVMGTEARLRITTNDPEAGDVALLRAAKDLAATECVLSRFLEHSELSQLNRSGKAVVGGRLLVAFERTIEAYEWSDGLLDPRVIDALERFGHREGVPGGDVGPVEPAEAPAPVDMRGWVDDRGRISLPSGVRLDLAGVGKALGIGWAATQLVGHVGLLVDVGGDVVALGTDEEGEPRRVAVVHDKAAVGMFFGSPLAVATSTTRRRAWRAAGREAHHLIDPRSGAPAEGDISSATVAAPTILEADLAAKLLIIEGVPALERLDDRYRVVLTDRWGRTEVVC